MQAGDAFFFNFWGGGVQGVLEARNQNLENFPGQVSLATQLMRADVFFSTCGGEGRQGGPRSQKN